LPLKNTEHADSVIAANPAFATATTDQVVCGGWKRIHTSAFEIPCSIFDIHTPQQHNCDIIKDSKRHFIGSGLFGLGQTLISFHPEMALFPLSGVLRGLTSSTYDQYASS
jgi:hypothetical protein